MASSQIDISVIIPTLNEADNLPLRIHELRVALGKVSYEIIISDGGSSDSTLQLAVELADHNVCCSSGRAHQLNAGAKEASGRWFYFLHADTQPPAKLAQWVKWMEQNDRSAACFRMCFDYRSPVLNFLGYCTRYDLDAFRYGDQSLLVSREAFHSVDGYNESFSLMEGNDLVKRLKKEGGFVILPDQVVTSARKYREYGTLFLQGLYVLIYCLQRLGWPQERLLMIYRRALSLATFSEALKPSIVSPNPPQRQHS